MVTNRVTFGEPDKIRERFAVILLTKNPESVSPGFLRMWQLAKSFAIPDESIRILWFERECLGFGGKRCPLCIGVR